MIYTSYMTNSKVLDGYRSTMDDLFVARSLQCRSITYKSMEYYTTLNACNSSGRQSSRYGTICNNHLHPSSHEQEDCSILQAAVHQIFNKARNDPTLSTLIKNLDPNQILSQLTCCVRQWVTISDNHIWAHHQAIQLWAKLCTQDIRQFFPWKTWIIPPSAKDKNMFWPP